MSAAGSSSGLSILEHPFPASSPRRSLALSIRSNSLTFWPPAGSRPAQSRAKCCCGSSRAPISAGRAVEPNATLDFSSRAAPQRERRLSLCSPARPGGRKTTGPLQIHSASCVPARQAARVGPSNEGERCWPEHCNRQHFAQSRPEAALVARRKLEANITPRSVYNDSANLRASRSLCFLCTRSCRSVLPAGLASRSCQSVLALSVHPLHSGS